MGLVIFLTVLSVLSGFQTASHLDLLTFACAVDLLLLSESFFTNLHQSFSVVQSVSKSLHRNCPVSLTIDGRGRGPRNKIISKKQLAKFGYFLLVRQMTPTRTISPRLPTGSSSTGSGWGSGACRPSIGTSSYLSGAITSLNALIYLSCGI